jgi:phage baseplate assembly protein W
MMNIGYPFQISYNGCTDVSNASQHINDLVNQVLFTMPGERVNRPTFGSGLSQLVFAPNGTEYTYTYQNLIQGSLQQWLGSLINIQSLQATNQDSTLQLTLQYVILSTQQQQVEQFSLTT